MSELRPCWDSCTSGCLLCTGKRDGAFCIDPCTGAAGTPPDRFSRGDTREWGGENRGGVRVDALAIISRGEFGVFVVFVTEMKNTNGSTNCLIFHDLLLFSTERKKDHQAAFAFSILPTIFFWLASYRTNLENWTFSKGTGYAALLSTLWIAHSCCSDLNSSCGAHPHTNAELFYDWVHFQGDKAALWRVPLLKIEPFGHFIRQQ